MLVRISCSVLILKRAEMHKSLLMRSCSFAQQEKMTWRKLFWVQQKHDEMKEIFWKVLFFLELNCYLFDQTITSGNLLKGRFFRDLCKKWPRKHTYAWGIILKLIPIWTSILVSRLSMLRLPFFISWAYFVSMKKLE